MRVALLHYHLRPGGVTSVIRNQAAALEGAAEVLVVSGEPVPGAFPAPVAVVPGLAYDARRDPGTTAAGLARDVLAAVERRWPGGADVVHVHNPTLAKNRLLLEALDRLRQAGVPLFLQVHDFAEDGRPAAYSPAPYPADAHYGVINSRDGRVLCRAGLEPEGVHLLPNEVRAPAAAAPAAAPGDHVLYPVRALRRKNVGEALLLAAFLPAGRRLAVTLPPHSEADLAAHRDWKAFAAQRDLPVRFDAGLVEDFGRLVQTARWLLTTSATEGFGFAFLEPWLAGKCLWGRRLPDICRDFTAGGVRLDHLYDRLHVPLDWIDRERYRRRWRRAMAEAHAAYGRTPDAAALDAAAERLAGAESVDFALLDEPLQREVIRCVLDTAAQRRRLTALNPFLARPGGDTADRERIAANRRAIARHYGRAAVRARLLAVYARVRRPVVQSIDKRRLLDAFLQPENFSLLKWGSCH